MEGKKPIICAAVAVGPYDVIGQNGVMPWHCRSDLYHFQKITTPHPCIFGRTTFENLPHVPLPNRFNIVCSAQYKNIYQNGVFYADSVESALQECSGYSKVFICGGAQIYRYAFDNDLVDILYLTQIKDAMLAENVRKNPDLYCHFYPGVSAFFNSPKWQIETIIYSKKELPTNTGNISAEFFKFNRTR